VFASAAVTGVLTFFIAFALPEATPTSQRARSVTSSNREVTRVGFVTAVAGATFGTLITFTTPFALLRGAERVAPYLIGYTLGALIVRVGLGKVADRAGRRKVAQLSLTGYGCVALITVLLSPGLLVVFGLGFGVAHGFLYPTLAAMAAESSSPERRGRTLANFNAAFNAGTGLALLAGGWVARAAGYPLLFSLVGVLALTSALFLAAPATTLVAPPESKP